MHRDAILTIEGKDSAITWTDYDRSKVFTVFTTNLSSDEVTSISVKIADLPFASEESCCRGQSN